MKGYPCILISGHYFHRNSGGGITLSNLFEGWDKNKIAAAASFITSPSFEICDNYYQLGSLEYELRFPFNLKHSNCQYYSGRIIQSELSTSDRISISESKSLFRRIYDGILFTLGLIHYRNKFRVNDKFLEWIRELRPEIIYSQLSSLEEMRTVARLQKELKLPVAIHIMDDWPSTISEKYFPKMIWRRVINKELKHLFNNAKVLLSISESMSEEYFKRYGLNFIPFHNPIDTKIWMAHSRTDSVVNESDVKVLYSGRIGIGISQSLVDVAETIDSMNIKGSNITLCIQTPTEEHEILKTLKNFKCIVINPIVEYSKIPEIFSRADILLLANDFDERAIAFLKFSMPTKASEYMISGTPIMVYSAQETAVTKFFSQYECGHCVSRKNKKELTDSINTLIHDQEYRNKISRNAIRVALERFDAEKVRSEFRNIFIDATQDGISSDRRRN